MVDGNYANPNFPVKHLVKDTDYFIEEAKEEGLNVSSILGVREILEMTMKMAMQNEDYSSLFEAIKMGEYGES